MSPRPVRSWIVFAACAAAIVLALCWVTLEVRSLAASEARARDEARVQEAMRLALWRIDSAFAPIVAQESVRAASDYPPPTGGAAPQSPFAPFRLYFAADGAGHASDPSVLPFLAEIHPQELADAKKRGAEPLRADAPAQTVAPNSHANTVLPEVGQVEWSKDEFQSRARMTQEVQDNIRAQVYTSNPVKLAGRGFAVPPPPAAAPADVVISAIEARWLAKSELFLLRTVTDRATRKTTTQGIWADWKKLEQWLLEKAEDVFPGARLEPVSGPAAPDDGSLLASVPARFVHGPIEASSPATRTTSIVIVAAWVAALVAIASVGGVLRAAMSLGERRGRFVSAVTHELRTPLTTFRMYAQMLADGMVSKDAHAEYLGTLKDESERLARVVESVLLYSRLEEGRGGGHREVMPCDALLDRALSVIRKRALDGGMRPEITAVLSEEAKVDVDAQAVEQVLLNLVDNACKYAQPADPRVEITCRTGARSLEVAVRDFGPAIPAEEAAAVFLPFRRGARDAAGTTPGVGLGLALARGLARALGGDLVYEPAGPGARFTLAIPRVA